MTGAGQGWFAASDAVGRYWLARCDGFEVSSEDGRLSGVVCEVERDDAGRASTLVVERNRRRPLELNAAAATLVDPWQRQVLVALPRRRPRTARVRTVAQTASRGGHAALAGAATVGAASLTVASTARRAGPPSGRFALWLGARVAYALAFAGWLYGAVLYAVSRAAARFLLMLLRAAARAGFWVLPPLARSMRAGARRALSHLTADAHRPRTPPSDPSRGRVRGTGIRRSRRGSLYW